MSDLMEKIVDVHWRFVECDDSPLKLQLNQELEAMVKEYLSVQPHDKKFFLDDTPLVLKKTVRELDGFTAHKAMLGFEAISQYANNLYTKPWRKEYAIVKLYSGFYQHEVKSNLVESEILFEAMGYRRISDDMLVMEGPICPDQVMNVSRDAVIAYVECQIMKEIFAGVTAMGFDVSWQDVYTMREKYNGGVKQGIHRLGYSLHDRYVRKEKLVDIDNNYTQPAATMQCQSCAYQTPQMVMSSSCAVHGPQVCSCQAGGRHGRMPSYASIAGSHMQSPQMPGGGFMTHSRSLDHYNPDTGCMQHLPQRHSFDQPMQSTMAPTSSYHHYQQIPPAGYSHAHAHAHHTYEQPYDCLNGGGSINSSVSYADVPGGGGGGMPGAYGHPYNVSGNRIPLPLNISNQLDVYANLEPHSAYGMKPAMAGYNARALQKLQQQQHMQPQYSSVPPMPPARQQSSLLATRDLGMMHHHQQQQQQRLAAAEQHLIDFNDQAHLTSHDFSAVNQHHYHEATGPRGMEPMGRVQNALYDQADGRSHGNGPLVDTTYDNCTYAKPMPRASRNKGSSNATDRYLGHVADSLQDMTLTDNNRKMPHNGVASKMPASHGLEREISEYSGESLYTDHLANTDSSGDLALKMAHKSPSQEVKNQDGMGSFGEWNYVYHKLEKNGYRKDVEERDDLLPSMDLDSLPPAAQPKGAPEKRRSNEAKAEAARLQMASVATNTEPAPPTAAAMEAKANKAKQEKSILKQPPASTIVEPPPAYQTSSYASAAARAASLSSTTGAIKKQKSALKPSIITTVTPPTPTQTAFNQGQDNKNGNEAAAAVASGRMAGARAKQMKAAATKATAANPAAATNGGGSCRTREWDCPHCTYTNNSASHICEVCCRTDIPPPTMSATKPTCV